MKKNNFLKALDAIRNIAVFDDKLNEVGIEFFNTKCFDSIYCLQRILFEESYGKEGWEWIEWYLFELPDLQEKYPVKKAFAYDKNKEPIIFDSDESLYDYLEENCNIKKYGTIKS